MDLQSSVREMAAASGITMRLVMRPPPPGANYLETPDAQAGAAHNATQADPLASLHLVSYRDW